MHLPEDDLQNILIGSARHLDRNIQLLERGGQGPDHPVHSGDRGNPLHQEPDLPAAAQRLSLSRRMSACVHPPYGHRRSWRDGRRKTPAGSRRAAPPTASLPIRPLWA